MKKILLILLTTFVQVSVSSFAQTPQWSWATDFGNTDFDSGNRIALDPNGNVITIGLFSDTVDFDPGLNSFQLIASGGVNFIIKQDPLGNLIWAKSFGDSLNSEATGVVVDSEGNIYLAGYINGIVDLDPDSVQVLNLGIAGTNQLFILKLNSDGTLVWAHCSTGAGFAGSTDIQLDNSGHLVCIGGVLGQIDIDADSTSLNSNDSSAAIFIARLDTSGNFDWVYYLPGGAWGPGPYIAIDNDDNIWITETFHDSIDVDPNFSSSLYLTASGLDVLLVKLSSQGNLLLAYQFGNNLDQQAYAIDCDGYNNVYLIGNFDGAVDFDPDPGNVYTLSTTAHWTLFMVKLNSTGTFQWAGKVGGNNTNFIFCHGADVDFQGNLYITGYYESTIDFDPDPIGQSVASSIFSSQDIFVAGYDSDGGYLFKELPQGTGDETGNDIAVDGNGKLVFAGASGSTFYLGPFHLVNAGSYFPLVYPTDIIIGQMDNVPVGIAESKPAISFKVYPNPANSSITIDIPGKNETSRAVICDLYGKSYIETSITNSSQSIDVSHLASGVYVLRIEEDSNSHIAKFVVSK